VDEILEDIVHHHLEHCGGVTQSEEHDGWLKQSLVSLECQASQPILSSLIRQAHCSYAGCLIGSKRPVYTWSMHA